MVEGGFDDVVEMLASLSDVELDAYVRACELERRSLEARLAASIAAAEARQVPALDCHLSTKSWLKASCNWNDREATRMRSVAHLLNEHPVVGRAWFSGQIGRPQVEALAQVRRHRRAGERFEEFVPTFVDHAEQFSFKEFDQILSRYVSLSDADGVHDEREAVQRRGATVNHVGGELALSASGGDASTTAEVLEIIARFEQREFAADCAARDAALAAGATPPPFRTGPQRRFDALVQIVRNAAAHAGVAGPAEPLVSVLVDEQTLRCVLEASGLGATGNLRGEQIDPFTGLAHRDVAALLDELTNQSGTAAPPTRRAMTGPTDGALPDLLGRPEALLTRRCETTTGVPLRTTDVLRALLSGHIRRVVLGANSRVIDLGRTSRTFTGAARDAARLLTVRCDHPGCDMPASWCQVDHSTEWWQGGSTDQANARIPCPQHNRSKHQRGWRTRRATTGRSYTIRTDGTVMLPVGCRPPVFSTAADDGIASPPTTHRNDSSANPASASDRRQHR